MNFKAIKQRVVMFCVVTALLAFWIAVYIGVLSKTSAFWRIAGLPIGFALAALGYAAIGQMWARRVLSILGATLTLSLGVRWIIYCIAEPHRWLHWLAAAIALGVWLPWALSFLRYVWTGQTRYLASPWAGLTVSSVAREA